MVQFSNSLKQTIHKPDRNWRSSKLVASHLAWLDSLQSYRKSLRNARAACYSALIEDNKHILVVGVT